MADIALTVALPGSASPATLFVSQGLLQELELGPWTAYLECSSPVAPLPGTPATLTLARTSTGTLDVFTGTVRRATSNPGSELLAVTLVGGKGLLETALSPLDHVDDTGAQPVTAALVARAICDAAGELLDPASEAALAAYPLPRWHRATDTTAATALDLLAYFCGLAWRVLPTGLVWLGIETWPELDGAAYWQGLDEDDGATIYDVTAAGAQLQVGQSIDGRQAIEVLYTLGGSSSAKVRAAVPGDPPHVPELDLYRGVYSGLVVAQRANGTIDVRCDDPRIGDLRALQLRVGLPGALVTLDLTVPTRVRVAFDGASPAGAYATGLLDQDPTATAPVALVGDDIECGAIKVTAPAGGGPCTILYSPPPPPGSAINYPFGYTRLFGVLYGPGSAQVMLR